MITNPAILTVNPAPPPVTSSEATPAPVPLVTVASVQFETEKLSRKKTAKVLVVNYSGALEPGSAQATGNYQLIAAGKQKKGGTHGASVGKAIAIASATYSTQLPGR